jgi:hypothetical protein
MDTPNKEQKPECCAGCNCSTPPEGSTPEKPSKNRWWKTIAFSGVMLLAVAVAAYVIWTRPANTTAAPAASNCCPTPANSSSCCPSK